MTVQFRKGPEYFIDCHGTVEPGRARKAGQDAIAGASDTHDARIARSDRSSLGSLMFETAPG
jgi:hypothetical protein